MDRIREVTQGIFLSLCLEMATDIDVACKEAHLRKCVGWNPRGTKGLLQRSIREAQKILYSEQESAESYYRKTVKEVLESGAEADLLLPLAEEVADRRAARAARKVRLLRALLPGESGQLAQKIIEAKNFPLREIIATDREGWAKCPFHNEKTPSFKCFDDNHFHCFGCGAHGDSISLARKIWGTDFRKTVLILSGGNNETN